MATASPTFDDDAMAYARAVLALLSKPHPSLGTRLLRAVTLSGDDPELRGSLTRTYDTLLELRRLNTAGRLNEGDRRRALELLQRPPEELSIFSAAEVLKGLESLAIEVGDASTVFEIIKDELGWTRGKTSWLTWDQLYPRSEVPGLKEFLDGREKVDGEKLTAARRRLLTLKRVRHDDQLVHRARQRLRAHNLNVLSAYLLFLIPVLIGLAWTTSGSTDLLPILLVPVAGAFGAAMAGARKASDRLPRSGDIRSFLDGLPTQLLFGAGSAIVVLLVLESGVVTFAGVDAQNWAARAVFGFVAGFSEPFFIGTVERVATLGAGKATDPTQTASDAPSA
jgi:hypothetical protein